MSEDKKVRHCVYCGVVVPNDSYEWIGSSMIYCCSESECDKALSEEMRAAEDDRYERAKEDGFSRY